MPAHDVLTDDYVASLLAKDAKESSIRYSALGLEGLIQSKTPSNKPKPNTRFLRNIIKDTDNHNAALLAKEAADAKVRLEGLSENVHREEKATRLGGGDIRRRQLGNIASILGSGGQPSKRKRPDAKAVELREKGRADSPTNDEVLEPRKRTGSDIRKRQLGDIAAILGGRPSKRQRAEGGEKSHKVMRRVNSFSDDERKVPEGSKSRSSRGEVEDGAKSRSHRTRERSEEGKRNDHKSDRRRHRSTSERREMDERRHWRREMLHDEKSDGRKRRRSRSRSRSPREHRKKDSRFRHRSPKRRRSVSLEPARGRKSNRLRRSPSETRVSERKFETNVEKTKVDYDSDPLDEIIGPRPPPVEQVRTRGRGTLSHGSGIDSRFSASYDPTVDVQLDPDEENDWDQALEALRDRQKWQKSGADRLRAAGFTEDEITKWEKGGEKREEDVKWTKQGESREWDRGKIFDEDGVVQQEPSWGRLNGT